MTVVHGLDRNFIIGAIDVGFLDEVLESLDELFEYFSLGETCFEHGCCLYNKMCIEVILNKGGRKRGVALGDDEVFE